MARQGSGKAGSGKAGVGCRLPAACRGLTSPQRREGPKAENTGAEGGGEAPYAPRGATHIRVTIPSPAACDPPSPAVPPCAR